MAEHTVVTDELLDKYFSVTEKALAVVKVIVGKDDAHYAVAQDFLLMARSYFNDAQHFRKQKDYVRAYGALNYAHAWLDAGARMRIFSTGDDDSQLFASD